VKHPFDERTVPLLPGAHVTTEIGTGFVHTAPDHGPDDFALGQAHGLTPLEYLDARGRFTSARPDLQGLSLTEAQETIIERLKAQQALLAHHPLEHAYQICWRHKKPIFYRATAQWFVQLTPDFRQEIIRAINTVQWYPEWGAERMTQMIAHRPDWCISRQRYWGSPLVLIYNPSTRAIHPQMSEIIEKVAHAISKQGLEAWFASSLEDWGVHLDEGWVKSHDVLDVWFDSGAVFHLLLSQEKAFPANLYLEGTDQYRGWFQSSLICSMGHQGQPPYREILTHGFIVDAHGKKMSKSLGNVVAPDEVAQKFGIDVLRLWVSCCNYREEMAIGDDILARTADTYRRLRNTIRFLLGNLSDFQQTDILPCDKMALLDRFIVERVFGLQEQARLAYARHDFDEVVRPLIDFCVNDLGGFYLDIIKDRLYTAAQSSQARRSAQTALYYLFISMTHQLAPVLSFTMEEAWQAAPFIKEKRSIFFNCWPQAPWQEEQRLSTSQYEEVIEAQNWRNLLQAPLEKMRQQGSIGSSLETHITLKLPESSRLWNWASEIKFVLLCSSASLEKETNSQEEPWMITKVPHEKCPRCWHRVPQLNPVCPRCQNNMADGAGEHRSYA
jgi:isoleucyl-tRNA synthetase